MTNLNLKKYFVLILAFLLTANAASDAYSYFDNTFLNQNNNMYLGEWALEKDGVDVRVHQYLSNYIDDQINTNGNTQFDFIYNQAGDKFTDLTIPNIFAFGSYWDFHLLGGKQNPTSVGYMALVDRVLDGNGNPVHDVNPAYSTTDLYQGYSYFTVYDANNSLTNSRYSYRLQNNVDMITSTPMNGINNISFYAAIGLSDTNDSKRMATANLEVSVSVDGINWTTIRIINPSIANSNNYAYGYYSVDVPATFSGQNIYVKLHFSGQEEMHTISRVVIDNLTLN